MKIVQSCSEIAPTTKHVADIALGTVFRYAKCKDGPYLKVIGGFVDLQINQYYTANTSIVCFNYFELPNARLVLE